jgi:hypothetical protein
VAAIAGVLAVTFLIGRESARGRQPAPATPITLASAEAVAPVTLGTTGTPLTRPADPSTPMLPAIEAPPPSPQTGVPHEAASAKAATEKATSTPDEQLRDEVASYFREVEKVQSQGKSWGDPEALAQKLLEQAGKGDVSGFDGLAAANQRVRDGLRALPVPEPCREHHRLTLTLLDESIAMLGRVKGQIGGADAASLAAMPAEGQDLERKAKNVDAMAAEIKRRFGL